MERINISEKGKMVLKNHNLCLAIVSAVSSNGEKIYTKEGLIIQHNGKPLTIKAAQKKDYSPKFLKV